MIKKFVKNLSNKNPTKDITIDDKYNKLKLSTANKKVLVKVDKNIIFGGKNIPVIAGPNGVESLQLMRSKETQKSSMCLLQHQRMQIK